MVQLKILVLILYMKLYVLMLLMVMNIQLMLLAYQINIILHLLVKISLKILMSYLVIYLNYMIDILLFLNPMLLIFLINYLMFHQLQVLVHLHFLDEWNVILYHLHLVVLLPNNQYHLVLWDFHFNVLNPIPNQQEYLNY